MIEFKACEIMSYFYDRIDDSLVIIQRGEKPKFALTESTTIEYKRDVKNVEIVKSCMPYFKKYLDHVNKLQFHPIGDKKKAFEITNSDYTYIFKQLTEYSELDGKQITSDIIIEFTIYQIPKGYLKDISHVTLDMKIVPSLIKFIEENFRGL